MYLSIIILPILGSLISGFLGRKIGIKGSQFISSICLFLSALLSTVAFYEVGLCSSSVSINLGTWIDSEIMKVSWEFLFDQLSIVFCIMITYITFLILVYTIYYMEGQPLSVVGSRYTGAKLSNSGDTLKVIVPSNCRKTVCGWINYSEKVTSYNMSENEMGNRGSKSKFYYYFGGSSLLCFILSIQKEAVASHPLFNLQNKWLNFVNEQRIDGSWFIKIIKFIFMSLRFILMGFERNYLIKILSKQLNINNDYLAYCCTLPYFAYNKIIKNMVSIKQVVSKLKVSTKASNNLPNIDPWFWTGLTDAEGSFSCAANRYV